MPLQVSEMFSLHHYIILISSVQFIHKKKIICLRPSADGVLFCLHVNCLLLVSPDDDVDPILDVFVRLPTDDIDIRKYWPHSGNGHESSRKSARMLLF